MAAVQVGRRARPARRRTRAWRRGRSCARSAGRRMDPRRPHRPGSSGTGSRPRRGPSRRRAGAPPQRGVRVHRVALRPPGVVARGSAARRRARTAPTPPAAVGDGEGHLARFPRSSQTPWTWSHRRLPGPCGTDRRGRGPSLLRVASTPPRRAGGHAPITLGCGSARAGRRRASGRSFLRHGVAPQREAWKARAPPAVWCRSARVMGSGAAPSCWLRFASLSSPRSLRPRRGPLPLIEAVQPRRVFGRMAAGRRRTSWAPPARRSPAISRSETASAAAASAPSPAWRATRRARGLPSAASGCHGFRRSRRRRASPRKDCRRCGRAALHRQQGDLRLRRGEERAAARLRGLDLLFGQVHAASPLRNPVGAACGRTGASEASRRGWNPGCGAGLPSPVPPPILASGGLAALAPAAGRRVFGRGADGDPAAPGVELGHHARRLGLARPAARGQGGVLLRGDCGSARATPRPASQWVGPSPPSRWFVRRCRFAWHRGYHCRRQRRAIVPASPDRQRGRGCRSGSDRCGHGPPRQHTRRLRRADRFAAACLPRSVTTS